MRFCPSRRRTSARGLLGHDAARNPAHGGAVHDRCPRGQGQPIRQVNKNIEHRYALVRHSDKSEAIARFLDLDPELYGVVFCRTRRDTQALAEELLKRGYRADALHGEMSQAQKDRVMLRFKQKHLQVLAATDAARASTWTTSHMSSTIRFQARRRSTRTVQAEPPAPAKRASLWRS